MSYISEGYSCCGQRRITAHGTGIPPFRCPCPQRMALGNSPADGILPAVLPSPVLFGIPPSYCPSPWLPLYALRYLALCVGIFYAISLLYIVHIGSCRIRLSPWCHIGRGMPTVGRSLHSHHRWQIATPSYPGRNIGHQTWEYIKRCTHADGLLDFTYRRNLIYWAHKVSGLSTCAYLFCHFFSDLEPYQSLEGNRLSFQPQYS